MFSRRLILFATLAAVGGCGGGGGSAAAAPTSNNPPPAQSPGGSTQNLTVGNNFFSPASDAVAVGSTVTWTWDTCSTDYYGTNSCGTHGIVFDDGAPGSSVQSSGSFSRTFAVAGMYAYHCAVHGQAMAGSITVR